MSMRSLQIYITEEMHELITSNFETGKMSANIERILRAHMQTPDGEDSLLMRELNTEVKKFNGLSYNWVAIVDYTEKKKSPQAPKEIKVTP